MESVDGDGTPMGAVDIILSRPLIRPDMCVSHRDEPNGTNFDVEVDVIDGDTDLHSKDSSARTSAEGISLRTSDSPHNHDCCDCCDEVVERLSEDDIHTMRSSEHTVCSEELSTDDSDDQQSISRHHTIGAKRKNEGSDAHLNKEGRLTEMDEGAPDVSVNEMVL
jgi:hypothetical protein